MQFTTVQSELHTLAFSAVDAAEVHESSEMQCSANSKLVLEVQFFS